MASGSVDPCKVFGAIAKIISEREGVEIKLVAVHKKEDAPKEKTS